MKRIKQKLSILLTAAMVMAMVPSASLAQEPNMVNSENKAISSSYENSNIEGENQSENDELDGKISLLNNIEGSSTTPSAIDMSIDISIESIEIGSANCNKACDEDNPHMITGTSPSNTIKVADGEHWIKLDNVDIKSASDNPFTIADNVTVNLILANGSGNILKATSDNYAGLRVTSDATLNISCENEGTDHNCSNNCGKLEAKANEFGRSGRGAAIGGKNGEVGGKVTISGGVVNATASANGAGIGGGSYGDGGIVIISGGIVTAAADKGAGIGGGSNRAGGIITISGGTVTATAAEGRAIGGGYINWNEGTTTITGGNINAVSVTNPINANNEEIALYTITVPEKPNKAVSHLSLNPVLGYDYGLNGVITLAAGTDDKDNKDGMLYVWLPILTEETKITAKIGEKTFEGTITIENGKPITEIALTEKIGKTEVKIEGISPATDLKYNGQPQNGYQGEITLDKEGITPEDLEKNYKGTDETIYDSDQAPTNAGNYTLTVKVPENNESFEGKQELNFTIAKQDLTIKAEDKTITKGQAKPAYTSQTTGLISGEEITGITYKDDAPDTNQTGTYTITPENGTITKIGQTENQTNNYQITHQSGSLTINENQTSGGGGGGNTPKKETSEKTEEVKIEAKNENGKASAEITTEQIQKAIDQAIEQANNQGTNLGETTAQINIQTGANPVETITLNLPKTVQDQIIKNETSNLQITIDGIEVSINLDLKAIKEISNQAGMDAQITITKTDKTKLSQDAQAAIGDRPVYDISITFRNGEKATDFGKGNITIKLPYTLKQGEKAENVQGLYINEQGEKQILQTAKYDEKEKVVIIKENHLSIYAVGYSEDSKYIDINGHWAKEYIDHITKQGLIDASSENTFAPDAIMTRGMFVTALGRLAKIDEKQYQNETFKDVSKESVANAYINWATEKGIVIGIGENNFAPERSVSREEMAVIITNYAVAMGITLEKTEQTKIFTDENQIEPWAKEQVKAIQEAGIIGGKQENQYDPKGTSTKAEVSAVLYNFIMKTQVK